MLGTRRDSGDAMFEDVLNVIESRRTPWPGSAWTASDCCGNDTMDEGRWRRQSEMRSGSGQLYDTT